WLEKACGERTSRLGYLKVEPLWDPLRTDLRFTDLVSRIGLPPTESKRMRLSASDFGWYILTLILTR
ncbi:MAG TPA: hypothetical protein VGF61_00235, partial [Candidatus Acidoferrum sp.]